MSFIALPMPTVLASFPNMALSFIRVAIFFLQANVTMSQDEAEDSSVGAQLGEAAVYNAWDKSNTLLITLRLVHGDDAVIDAKIQRGAVHVVQWICNGRCAASFIFQYDY